MTFNDNAPQDPYLPPSVDADDRPIEDAMRRRQSGMGITSFTLAIVTGVMAFALVGMAAFMVASTPGGVDAESPLMAIVGLGFIAVVAFNLLGIGLGIGGLVQRDRLRTFAVLGVTFNLLMILGLGGLMAVGLLAG